MAMMYAKMGKHKEVAGMMQLTKRNFFKIVLYSYRMKKPSSVDDINPPGWKVRDDLCSLAW